MTEEFEQRIRQRAYELWIVEGKPEGSSMRFWKEAQRLLHAEQDAEDLERPADYLADDKK